MRSQQLAHMTVRYGSSFAAYLLDHEDMFSSADYKLLNGQTGGGLIPCLQSRFNGFVKLTYFPDGLVPIQSCMADITPDQFLTVLAGLLETINHVEANGLFNISKIDMDLDAFYVNEHTYEVGIIYLPIRQNVSGNSSQEAFNLFCQTVLASLRSHEQLRSLIRVIAGSANGAMGRFDYLLNRLMSSCSIDVDAAKKAAIPSSLDAESVIDSGLYPPPLAYTSAARRRYFLQGTFGNRQFKITIDEGVHVLGKSSAKAHYVIVGVNTVSNRHCEINKTGERLSVRDMGSTNGTFINGRRLTSNAYTELKTGDCLKVASLELMVREVN